MLYFIYNIIYCYLHNIIYYRYYNNLQKENKNKICSLCLENNELLFYNYNYKKNKYNHYCECTPEIHYNCFKECYKLKKHCIICQIKIKKIVQYNIFTIQKLRYILLLIILYELFIK